MRSPRAPVRTPASWSIPAKTVADLIEELKKLPQNDKVLAVTAFGLSPAHACQTVDTHEVHILGIVGSGRVSYKEIASAETTRTETTKTVEELLFAVTTIRDAVETATRDFAAHSDQYGLVKGLPVHKGGMLATEAIKAAAENLRIVADSVELLLAKAGKPEPTKDPHEDFVFKYLDLSTSHITKEEAKLLEDDVFINKGLVYTADKDFGWWIWAPPEEWWRGELGFPLGGEDIPKTMPNLRAVLEYARKLGCRQVRLDRDADVLADLPTFDW